VPSTSTFGSLLDSALGQKRTFSNVRRMSALPPKADIDQHSRDVCFVPKADISAVTVDDIFSDPYRSITTARQAAGILAKVSGGFGLGGTFAGGGCRMDGLNHESRA